MKPLEVSWLKLFLKNFNCSLKKSQVFTIYQDNQTSVTMHIFQGERPLTKDNHSLAKFDLIGIPPALRDEPKEPKNNYQRKNWC